MRHEALLTEEERRDFNAYWNSRETPKKDAKEKKALKAFFAPTALYPAKGYSRPSSFPKYLSEDVFNGLPNRRQAEIAGYLNGYLPQSVDPSAFPNEHYESPAHYFISLALEAEEVGPAL
ncbi:hypothetical protein HDU87_006649 [Geranomyces variabilis]|uniref:Uncharacterized protein n=1 Tax=Geranomyces variabilis TaxID=109894 RepID=A0AAD5XK70_9FUNG|nr:hypothetical protein HDU87_006649 [Geranomyces variabilis]